MIPCSVCSTNEKQYVIIGNAFETNENQIIGNLGQFQGHHWMLAR